MMNKLILTTIVASMSFACAEKTERPHKLPEHIIEKFDADGDGKLNEAERATAKEERKKRHAKMKELKNSYDTDGDGKLNDTERAAFQEARQAIVEKHFDANNDGVLDLEEQDRMDSAKKLHEGMRKKNRQRQESGASDQ